MHLASAAGLIQSLMRMPLNDEPQPGEGGVRLPEPPAGDRAFAVASLDLRDGSSPTWNAWDVLLIAATFLVSGYGATTAAGLYAFHHYHEPLSQLAFDARVIVSAQTGAYAITFALMYFLVTRIHHCRFWRGIRWIWPGKAMAAGIFLAGMPLALGISFLESVLPMPHQVPFERLFSTAHAAYILGGLAVVVAPFMEELFFRGFLFPALQRLGALVAVLLTSVTFAAVHGAQYGWAWTAVLLMFVVGLVLTLLRARTGSVVPGFLLHVAYNLTLFVMLYLSTDHFRHLERMGQ